MLFRHNTNNFLLPLPVCRLYVIIHHIDTQYVPFLFPHWTLCSTNVFVPVPRAGHQLASWLQCRRLSTLVLNSVSCPVLLFVFAYAGPDGSQLIMNWIFDVWGLWCCHGVACLVFFWYSEVNPYATKTFDSRKYLSEHHIFQNKYGLKVRTIS